MPTAARTEPAFVPTSPRAADFRLKLHHFGLWRNPEAMRCVDCKGGNLAWDLRAAGPKESIIYFENVGVESLETIALQLNPFARVPLCGLISRYSEGIRVYGDDDSYQSGFFLYQLIS